MTNATLTLIESYILDYLAKVVPDFKKTKHLFTCPKCHEHANPSLVSASLTKDNHVFCNDPQHGDMGNIYNIVRIIEEDFSELNDEEIAAYLIKVLKIKIDDDVQRFLTLYQQAGFDLVPVAKNDKIAIEKQWEQKTHKDIGEWNDWLSSGCNIGIKTGKISNITVIDVDNKECNPNLQSLRDEIIRICEESNTLVQETSSGGKHYVFKYDAEIPQLVDLGRADYGNGTKIDTRNDGGYIVAYPSIVDDKRRRWIERKIVEFPVLLKDIFKQYAKKSNSQSNIAEEIKKVQTASLEEALIGIQEGGRDMALTKFGGILRSNFSTEQTGQILSLVNRAFCSPSLPDKDIKRITESLGKYSNTDRQALMDKIVKHLKLVQESTARDLKESLRADKKEVEECLAELIALGKLYKNRSYYKVMEKAEWKDSFIKDSAIIDYKMPFFHDYMTFRNGDLVVIGARSGIGKSVLAMNIIKQLVNQGKVPYYVNLESGNRFVSHAIALGLREGQFKWTNHYSPESIELEDNAITIVDWLCPSDFTQVAQIYQKFTKQLDKHGGNLIVFNQLKRPAATPGKPSGHDVFFAENLLEQFPAFIAKYLYTQNGNQVDNRNTQFITTKVRESKVGTQKVIIPTYYDDKTKTITIRRTDVAFGENQI